MTVRTPADRPARLDVGVIGAGRVGAVLGAALARAGHHVTGITAVSRASTRRAADLLPDTPIRAVDEVATDVQLLVLAVPDDVLPDLVRGLAANDVVRRGTLVAHTSGAHGIAVLEPLTRAGALPLALHPVMTFTGTEVDLQRLAGAAFGVTAPEELRPVAEVLVLEMGAEPVWVEESMRPLYHAALAFGANLMTTLVTESAALLKLAGAGDPQRLLGPLLGAALDNALRRGVSGLTGPVARGDAGTVQGHLRSLSEHDPAARPSYVALSRLTALRALDAGLLPADRAELLLDALAAPADGDVS